MLQFLLNRFVKSWQLKFYFILLFFVVTSTMKVYSAPITSEGSVNWISTSACTPCPSVTIPLLSDDIIIAIGVGLAAYDNRISNLVTFTAPTKAANTSTLTVNSGFQLTVNNSGFFSYSSSFNKRLK